MYGVTGENSTATFTAYIGSGANWRFSDTTASVTIAASGGVYLSAHSNGGVTVDDTKYSLKATPSNFTSFSSLILGGNKNATSTYASFIGKIFRFRMYDNDTLVLDYIPCHNADGIYGFWDTVTQTFYQSNTSTTLEGGNL